MKAFGYLFYYFLKAHLFFAYRLYYSKFQLHGMENVPKEGAVIFAPNHQNALVDSLLAGGPTWRCPHFLARADVFKNKHIGAFLRGLKMLPVYRFRDGLAEVKKNSASFEACHKMLLQGKSLLMFPEGNHNFHFRLRPLQKGLPRIAFEALEQADFQTSLKVVPVGIQYEDHFRGGSRVLLSFGKPIEVADYEEAYRTNPRRAYDALLAQLHGRIKELIVHIPKERYEEVFWQWKEKRVWKSDLVDQLRADQQVVKALVAGDESALPKGTKKHGLSTYKVFVFLMLPIHAFPAWLVEKITQKLVKEKQFFGSVHFVLSMYLYPLFYLFAFLLIFLVFVILK